MTNLNLQGQITNSNEVDGGLYIEGEMFNSKKDLDGEMDIITPNAFEMALPEFLSIPMIVEHGQTRKYQKNKIQYENIRYEYLPKDYKMDTPKLLPMSIKVSMIIKDKNVIEDIKNGNLSGFSLNWLIIEGRKDLRTGAELYTEIKPVELTLTKNPAKKDCYFQIITNDELVKEYLAKTWQYEKSNVKIKSIYKNEFNNLFCDVEHLGTKQKSFKVPVENIKSKPILFFKMKSKKFGCVMANVNTSLIKKLQSKIDKDDLFIEENKTGIEENPHITILYGLEPTVKFNDVKNNIKESDSIVRDILDQERLGSNFDVFINEDKEYDVLIIKMHNQNDLIKLRASLELLPHTKTFDVYIPHITLAYLKKGLGQKYVDILNDEFNGQGLSFQVTDIVFSSSTQDTDYDSLLNRRPVLFLFAKRKSKPKPRLILFSKRKSVKNPKDLSINNLDTKSAKNQLDTALADQISQAIFNEKNEDWSIKSIENYLSFEGIKKIYNQIIKSTTNLYNNFNGTNYSEKNLPEQISQFRDLFAKITLFGWQNVNQNDFDKSVIEKINIPKTYKGIDQTTLDNLRTAGKSANLETITQNRQQTIWEGNESTLYQETMEDLATEDGKEFVGVITAGDNRVGEDHRPNDRKYSKYGVNGLNKHSSRHGCRCVYFRGTEAEMLKYGFSKI